MAAGAKSKNPQAGQATTNISKSLSGGKILSLIDIQHSLTKRVIRNKKNMVNKPVFEKRDSDWQCNLPIIIKN